MKECIIRTLELDCQNSILGLQSRDFLMQCPTSGFQMEGKHYKMAAVQQARALSDYFRGLEPNIQARYSQKIVRCGGIDPYCLKKKDFSQDLKDLPEITEVDISNYLVTQTSFFTRKQFKNHKSMEAHNFFTSGWVHELGVKVLRDNLRLIFARVSTFAALFMQLTMFTHDESCKCISVYADCLTLFFAGKSFSASKRNSVENVDNN